MGIFCDLNPSQCGDFLLPLRFVLRYNAVTHSAVYPGVVDLSGASFLYCYGASRPQAPFYCPRMDIALIIVRATTSDLLSPPLCNRFTSDVDQIVQP